MIRHLSGSETAPAKCLVIGDSGFVGKALTAHLKSHGMKVDGVSSAACNLLDAAAAEKIAPLISEDTAVIFAAALTPDRGKDEAAFMKNVSMVFHTVKTFAAKKCAHLIYISSDAVYGDQANPIRESSPAEPPSLYGMGHKAREMLLSEAAQKAGTPYLIVRPCALYGAGDTHNSYGPNRFAKTAKAEKKIVLFGEGEEKRDHLFVRDLCELLRLCLTNRTVGLLNACTGEAVSFLDVARLVQATIGPEVTIETGQRSGEAVHRHFNASVLRKAFPKLAITPLRSGLEASMR